MEPEMHGSNGHEPSRRAANESSAPPPLRVAATGDLHCTERDRARIATAFEKVAAEADLILIAGDVTTHGTAEEAAVLADACRPLAVPVVAVLGNHDWHAGEQQAVAATLGSGGIEVLDRGWTSRPLPQGDI